MAAQTQNPRRHRAPKVPPSGRAQLTLVEHALCPLDSSLSLKSNFIHEASHQFTDTHRNRRTARAKIGGLDGMAARDELYLWGLLAIALSQPEPKPDLLATPYYCLRHLGMISNEKRGGREFELFRAAIKRLAGMRYQNDAFYDPVRGEHRAVSFGFLNYSLPLDPNSSRAWRFAWDPIFFELAQATGGALTFDLDLYRHLDPATRRLYLLLKKLFWRRETTPTLDLRQTTVDVLGFSATLEAKHLKQKLTRSIEQLASHGLVSLPAHVSSVRTLFQKNSPGVYCFSLVRGANFNLATSPSRRSLEESPVFEALSAIGLDLHTIRRVTDNYSPTLVEQWADITLAAKERHGDKFFTKSPQAYFIDNLKAAAKSRRTPPDWWRELRKKERELEVEQQRSNAMLLPDNESREDFEKYLEDEAREAFDKITRSLITDLQKAGKSEPEARDTAADMARTHLWHRFQREHPEERNADGFQRIGSLL